VNYEFWGTLVAGPHARLADWPGVSAMSMEMVTRSIGLLVDQEFGLLMYAAVYLLALAGVRPLAKSQRDVAWSALFVIACYLALIVCPLTNVHGWTGGWNPAGRFVTPIVPLLGMFVCPGLRRAPRVAAIAVVTLQVAISAYVWQHPKTLWNDGDGRASICEPLGNTVCGYLPSLAQPSR
jgi:hypothetical protein